MAEPRQVTTDARSAQEALLKQLKEPFDPKFVKWRIQQVNKNGDKALALAYLDAREVYKRLDDVCGVGGWQDRITEIKDGFVCELSLFINGQWVTKSDAADFTDIEAIKGGASSALKRAAAVWGIGRYLYYMPGIWTATKVLYTKKNGDPVYGLAEQPQLPEWAIPSENIQRWEEVAQEQLNQEPESGYDGKTLIDYEVEVGELNTSKAIIEYMKNMTIEEKRVVNPIIERRIADINATREQKTDA